MRQVKDREAQLIHFSFFDILFGAFGAFVFLMLLHVVRTMSFIDIDLQKAFDELVAEKKELVAQVNYYRDKERAYTEMERLYNEANAKIKSLTESNYQLQTKVNNLEKELTALNKIKEEYLKKGDIAKALEKENLELKKSLEEAHKKLSAIKTIPLKIKTVSLPTLVTGENVKIALSAEGGVPPYRWEVEGKLPSGFYLDKANGLIMGQTSKDGNYSIKVTVQDTTGLRATSESISFSVIQKPEPQKKRLPNWVLIITGIAVALAINWIYRKIQIYLYIKKLKEYAEQNGLDFGGFQPVFKPKAKI
jgi:cell division protein FtsB